MSKVVQKTKRKKEKSSFRFAVFVKRWKDKPRENLDGLKNAILHAKLCFLSMPTPVDFLRAKKKKKKGGGGRGRGGGGDGRPTSAWHGYHAYPIFVGELMIHVHYCRQETDL